jgi:FtsZ-binding cell division protein ZapB
MSQSNPASAIPRWLSVSIIVLLTAQVGLLWTHGSMLQRQHDDIQSLREDLQALADDLYQDQDGWDSSQEDPTPQPARQLNHQRSHRQGHRHGRALARARFLAQAPAPEQGDQDEATQAARKDMDAARKSERDAVAKARTVQEQLSLSANAAKAEEKAKQEEQGRTWMNWAWAAFAVVCGVALVRVRKVRRD